MLNWLIALILLALLPIVFAVYPAAPLPAVVAAGMVAAVPSCRSMRVDFVVAARFARDTARNDRAENEDRGGHAARAGFAGDGSATLAGVAADVPDLRAVRIAGSAGVESLTVAEMP